MATKKPREPLKIGDFVTFRSTKHDAFICAEGILLEDLILNQTLASLDDALFCVHLQRQYSASRELDEYLTGLKESGEDESNPSVIKFLKALQKGRNNEIKLNNNYMRKRQGEPVRFGDVIQLFHCKSGKYLTVFPTDLANEERENMKVSLNTSGNTYSWLVIKPRFKIDREGDAIQDASEMYLGASERNNEFIHCAERDPMEGHFREINCSLEQTPWRMSIFQSSADAVDPKLLLASQMVYINDPETGCNLTIGRHPLESLDDDEEDGNGGDEAEEEEEEEEEGDEEEEEEDGVGEDEHFHAHGDLIAEPMIRGVVDSRTLWFVESRILTQGGPIVWRNSLIRFRHMFSGKYMLLKTVPELDEDGEVVDKYLYTVTDDTSDPGTLFSVTERNSASKLLMNAKPYQLNVGGVYVKRGEQDDKVHFIEGTRDKNAALSLLLVRYSEKSEEQLAKEAAEESIAAIEPLDVYAGLAARNYLQKYLGMIVLPKAHNTTTIWPSADRNDMQMFQMIIERSVNFSQGFSISAVNVVLSVDKSDPLLCKRRQKLLCELGILEVVLRIINKLIPIMEKLDAKALLPRAQQTDFSEEEQAVIDMAILITSKCLNLLYYCILDNPENQLYVADFMPALLAYLATQPLAGKCVTEMLSKNKELQETKITTREIGIFVQKLRSSKMNSMYLQLLQACCSCEGDGVDGNQCKVAEMIFENTNDIIIHVHADYAKMSQCDWGELGLYIPETIVPGSPIYGEALLTQGLPQLSLSWTTNSIDFSPLGLFGKLSVNVMELYRKGFSLGRANLVIDNDNAEAKKLAAKKNASVEQKRAVAEYFIAEMYLGAEMCMDRNYVAMHQLDNLFSFDVLVTMLKMDVNDQLKAAAARILLCLHVDRDPQASSQIPVLTRTWSEISKFTEPKLPYVEPQHRFKFALLQQLLSEHVRHMSGQKWNELSRFLLQFLRVLVNFNFYGSIERMQDLINPLISAIDRRNIQVAADPSIIKQPTKNTTESESKAAPSSPSKLSPRKVSPESKYEESKDDPTIDDVTREEGEGEEVEKEEKLPWQRRLLTFMESLPVMCSILTLVVAAVCTTIFQLVTDADDDPGTPLYIWGLVVLIIFLFDVCSRSYCYAWVYGKIMPWLCSIFNQIDMLVIAIDVVFLILQAVGFSGGSNAGVTKLLRLIRLLRLLRLVRAVKVINHIVEAAGDEEEVIEYKIPARYAKAPMFELLSMVEIVDILLYCERVVQDRNLSIFLRKFYEWESGEDTREPAEIFESVMETASELTLGVQDFAEIFIDVLMFIHSDLTQGALDILMLHHATRRSLLNNAKAVQLLISPKRERQFRLIDQMLQQLERNAETHELWGELESEPDYAVSKQTKDILLELKDISRIKRIVLSGDQEYMPDPEIQDLFRNLGCFGICEKVLGLFDSIEDHTDEESGEIDEVGLNTRSLVLMCNELLYWYCLDNTQNQAQAYESLDFFMESLDGEIKSHMVIRSIFSMNEYLMKLVPHVHLTEMMSLVAENGKSHHYLALSAAITNVGDRNIIENQLEIIRTITAPGRLARVGSFLCPVDHPEYARKIEMMEPLAGMVDLKLDDLPPELAYHLTLLEVLAGCTAGRLSVSSIEARIQSVYNYVDVVAAILDPRTILIAKLKTCSFLFNAIIEVELVVPGLGISKCMWMLVETFIPVLRTAADDLIRLDKLGWDAPGVSRSMLEYQQISIGICAVFFDKNYEASMFTHETGSGADIAHLTQEQANNIVKTLFNSVKAVYDLNSPRLSEADKDYVKRALLALNKSVVDLINPDLEDEINAHASEKRGGHEEIEMGTEKRIQAKYQEYLKLLQESESFQSLCNEENIDFISKLEELPYLKDVSDTDVRFEPFIKKLITHIRENTTIIDGETRIGARCTKTTIWLIKSFRTMIENKMGMDIFQRDEDGGAEQDEMAAPVVKALNTNGVTALCLDLIADGIGEELQEECIKLLVALLFKEGGARDVQHLMHTYLSRPTAQYFFNQASGLIDKLVKWHEWTGVVTLEEGAEPELPPSFLIVRMLQLMSEGHWLENQDLMREQEMSNGTVNLLDAFVIYLKALSYLPCRTSTAAGLGVSATILEVLQGPCAGNQQHLALNTDLLETLNRIIRAKPYLDCEVGEEIEYKKTVVDILEGLLEAQNPKGLIYERVLSVLHVDVIRNIALRADDSEEEKTEMEQHESFEDLKIECIVLLQMLCDARPAIKKEFNIPEDLREVIGDNTAGIEIFWMGEMHRRFFKIPDVSSLLSKASKDGLVEFVERESHELKLIDFMERAKGLYSEVTHQKYLVEKGLNAVFSLQNQKRATDATFTIATVINFLYLCYYDSEQHITPTITAKPSYPNGYVSYPDAITAVINALNIIQVVISAFTVVLNFVVRSPVIYGALEKDAEDNGYTGFHLIAYTACDPMTMYYVIYMTISILGLVHADFWITFLLLDIIVKNPTAQNVLLALIVPRENIFYALFITEIINYNYAFYLFMYFPNDANMEMVNQPYTTTDCYTLWGCWRYTTNYGTREGGGIGDNYTHTVGRRWLLDMTYYLVVIVGIFNLVAGIIISTFSRLREDKNERMRDTEGLCFICGLEKQVFDRAAQDPKGFQIHIKQDHNMWNYLNFVFFIWEQDKDDDDGMEYFVRNAIDNDDLEWIPASKAMRLNQSATEEEKLESDLRQKLKVTRDKLDARVNSMQTNIGTILEQMTQVLKKDHADEEDANKGKSRGRSRTAGSASKEAWKRAKPITKGEEELDQQSHANSLEENSVHSTVSAVAQGKRCFLEIIEITGICGIDDVESVSCRIVCEAGLHNVQAKFVDEATGRIGFESEPLPICDDATSMDERMCRVQLVQNAIERGVASSGSINSFSADAQNNRAKFIAVIDLPIDEMVSSNDCFYEKIFSLAGSPDDSEVGTILLRATCL